MVGYVQPLGLTLDVSVAYDRGMLTLAELVQALRAANVVETSELSGVSTKTIYRIRTQDGYDPGAKTMERLEKALRVMRKRAPERAGAQA